MIDEGWWFQAVEGFCFMTEKRLKIGRKIFRFLEMLKYMVYIWPKIIVPVVWELLGLTDSVGVVLHAAVVVVHHVEHLVAVQLVQQHHHLTRDLSTKLKANFSTSGPWCCLSLITNKSVPRHLSTQLMTELTLLTKTANTALVMSPGGTRPSRACTGEHRPQRTGNILLGLVLHTTKKAKSCKISSRGVSILIFNRIFHK